MQDEIIQQVGKQLFAIREQLRAGEIYQSLGSKIGAILDSLPIQSATPVELPDDNDGIKPLLKELQTGIRDHTLTEVSDDELLKLIDHLGSPDSEIRDHGIYFFFNDAMQQQVITDEQLRKLFTQLMADEPLYAHILEPANDAIYQRSFRILVLSVLLYADRAGYHFLNHSLTSHLVDQLTIFLALEHDTRGFVGHDGWAHVFTHLGNILDEVTELEDLPRADKLFLLAVFFERYKRLDTPLISGEAERLAGYLADIANKNALYSDFILQSLKKWRHEIVAIQSPNTEQAWTKMFNRGRLLTAMLLRDDFPAEVTDYLSEGNDYLA